MPTNPDLAAYPFLAGMYDDAYFPDALVDKGAAILVRLCERVEAERPADLPALYALTAAATHEFNALDEEFGAAGGGIETVGRDVIATDILHIATSYGFPDADIEDLVAERDW
ncbi:DUF5713 family protein [Actinomadura flavalba]|uniref:DUF5713 family protein n=1 Tax=Actinomadura flavalba TaxID=1120938 RepID=UPI000364AE23|nr:DUF5713 family protein [Actinomadura flavalba]